MAKNPSEKAADGLVEGVVRRDWNPQLFVGYLFQQPKEVQQILIITFLLYLRQYKENADNPNLSWRVDPEAADYIDPVDLTGYDI
jgi:hypothetical protein